MLTFFCTRCGTRLEIEDEFAGGRVQCGHCSGVVRGPQHLAADVPFARVAEPETPAVPLSYVPAWPERHDRSVAIDLLAERLNHVQAAEGEDDPDAMTQCPYCGSTIARYFRKCPFCRHPLWGI